MNAEKIWAIETREKQIEKKREERGRAGETERNKRKEERKMLKTTKCATTVKYYCHTKAIYDAFRNHYTFLYYKFIYVGVKHALHFGCDFDTSIHKTKPIKNQIKLKHTLCTRQSGS